MFRFVQRPQSNPAIRIHIVVQWIPLHPILRPKMHHVKLLAASQDLLFGATRVPAIDYGGCAGSTAESRIQAPSRTDSAAAAVNNCTR